MTEAMLRALIQALEADLARLDPTPDAAREAGRVFSAANEAQMRAALTALNSLLAQVSAPPDPAEQQPPAPGQQPAKPPAAPPPFVQQGGAEPVAQWAVESAEPMVMAVSEAVAKGKGLARIITPGWGSSGFYGAQMLERDAPVAFPAGTKMYWDHPAVNDTRPERSLRDLAAETTEPGRWMAAGPEGPGVYAKVKVFSGYQPAVDELKEHIGLSIRSAAMIKPGEAEGRKGPIVERLIPSPTNSVDFVTIPGRGGRITALFESHRGGSTDDTQEDDVTEAEAKAATERAEKAERERDEALARVASQEATNVAAALIAKVDMPQASRMKVLAEVVKAPAMKDGALDKVAFEAAVQKAADAEKAYVDQITGRGKVTGMGSGTTEGASGTTEVTEAEMAAAFARIGLTEAGAKIAGRGRN